MATLVLLVPPFVLEKSFFFFLMDGYGLTKTPQPTSVPTGISVSKPPSVRRLSGRRTSQVVPVCVLNRQVCVSCTVNSWSRTGGDSQGSIIILVVEGFQKCFPVPLVSNAKSQIQSVCFCVNLHANPVLGLVRKSGFVRKSLHSVGVEIHHLGKLSWANPNTCVHTCALKNPQ